MLFQFTNGTQTIHSVSGKTGYGFCYDKVDTAVQRLLDHRLKSLSALDAASRNALICEYSGKFPISTALDIFGVIIHLRLVGTLLFLMISGHAGVGCDLALCRCCQRQISETAQSCRNRGYSFLHIFSLPSL